MKPDQQQTLDEKIDHFRRHDAKHLLRLAELLAGKPLSARHYADERHSPEGEGIPMSEALRRIVRSLADNNPPPLGYIQLKPSEAMDKLKLMFKDEGNPACNRAELAEAYAILKAYLPDLSMGGGGIPRGRIILLYKEAQEPAIERAKQDNERDCAARDALFEGMVKEAESRLGAVRG